MCPTGVCPFFSKFSIYLGGRTSISMFVGYVLDMGISRKMKSQSNMGQVCSCNMPFKHEYLKEIKGAILLGATTAIELFTRLNMILEFYLIIYFGVGG